MGNSDSKQQKGTSGTPPQSQQPYQTRVHSMLESEFEKRSDYQKSHMSCEAFQACLKTVQDEFDLYSIAYSPLGVGLFELYTDERPEMKSVMSLSEYAMAMAVLFNNNDPSTVFNITTQAILRWYAVKQNLPSVPRDVTKEMIISFFEASWSFAWSELSRRVLSNVCLNGKAETEAIQRFSETHSKYFATNPSCLSLKATDRTITVSVGDETVQVPTSFSYLSRPRTNGSETPPLHSRRKGNITYPEL